MKRSIEKDSPYFTGKSKLMFRTLWYDENYFAVKQQGFIEVPKVLLDAMHRSGLASNKISYLQSEILLNLIAVEQGALQIKTIDDLRKKIYWDFDKRLCWSWEECKIYNYKDKCNFNPEEEGYCNFWREKNKYFANRWDKEHPDYEKLTNQRLIDEINILFDRSLLFESMA